MEGTPESGSHARPHLPIVPAEWDASRGENIRKMWLQVLRGLAIRFVRAMLCQFERKLLGVSVSCSSLFFFSSIGKGFSALQISNDNGQSNVILFVVVVCAIAVTIVDLSFIYV